MVKENNTTISICILRLSSIGDITHIIPIISTLRNEYKRAKITWIIGKTEYQLVKNLDDINFKSTRAVSTRILFKNSGIILDIWSWYGFDKVCTSFDYSLCDF